jgi:ArsR family transcriptional regulator, arsenate/arsenite/antimonite-responsive transcriptional repressor
MKCFCPKEWYTFFKAIHDRHRQQILDIIKQHKEINATGIVDRVKLSQPTVSHHLKILCDASVLKTKKVGKEVFYSINKDFIHDCCSGFMRQFSV